MKKSYIIYKSLRKSQARMGQSISQVSKFANYHLQPKQYTFRDKYLPSSINISSPRLIFYFFLKWLILYYINF